MKIKATLILLLSFSFVSSQEEIPNKQELIGDWILTIKIEEYTAKVREYILIEDFQTDNYNEKIYIEKNRIAKIYNTKGIRCGNDHRISYNKSFKYSKISWKYDEKDGILEISSKSVINGYKKFLVRKLDSRRILLTGLE
ncbi:hypothetical protein [Aquimarina sp. 2304DJ70-9]|uniref:hypothetical protein n=1 Tax=Aquimarina penaris TaxID=3231044 RepID=UPI003462C36A